MPASGEPATVLSRDESGGLAEALRHRVEAYGEEAAERGADDLHDRIMRAAMAGGLQRLEPFEADGESDDAPQEQPALSRISEGEGGAGGEIGEEPLDVRVHQRDVRARIQGRECREQYCEECRPASDQGETTKLVERKNQDGAPGEWLGGVGKIWTNAGGITRGRGRRRSYDGAKTTKQWQQWKIGLELMKILFISGLPNNTCL